MHIYLYVCMYVYRRGPRGTHTMSNSLCLSTCSCARVLLAAMPPPIYLVVLLQRPWKCKGVVDSISLGRREIRRILRHALGGIQFSGSLAPCQAQSNELSAKLQQDRDVADAMLIGAMDWGGASAKRLCRSVSLHVGVFRFGPTFYQHTGQYDVPRIFTLRWRIANMQSLKSDNSEVRVVFERSEGKIE